MAGGFPLKKATTGILIKKLENEIFSRFRVPEVVIVDNGPQFRRIFNQWCVRMGIQVQHTPTYHPRANPIERMNANLKEGMRLSMTSHDCWDASMFQILFSLRNRCNNTTKFPPALLLYGTSLKKPGQWQRQKLGTPPALTIEEIRDQAIKSQSAKTARIFNLPETKKRPPVINTSDQILVKGHALSDASKKYHAGFASKWVGPLTVLNERSPNIFDIQGDIGTVTSVHRDQIKKYTS